MCTIWIDVKLLFTAGGRWGTLQPAANEDAAMFLWKRTCIILYICIVPPLGASKSQLAGKKIYIYYRCCFKLSTSTVILYIEVHLIVLCCCWCFFARLMHFAAQFSTTVLIKCVQLILLGIWLELGVWHAHSLLCLQLVKYPLDTYCILGYRGYHSIIDSVFERCRLQPFFLVVQMNGFNRT